MPSRFTDPRLAALNDDGGFVDQGMRRALSEALEPGEVAVATYSVSAHIWVQAVLTDRALLLVKGAVRARVSRAPLPLEILRAPAEVRKGVRVRTPLGKKTLWGSRLDPEGRRLLQAADAKKRSAEGPGRAFDPRSGTSEELTRAAAEQGARSARQVRQEARRAAAGAGARPRKPHRRRVRKRWVGFAPSSTIWELADYCVKCGRALTDPRSRKARVGTKCIRIHGSQQRRIPNPAHAAWTAKKAKADADYIAEKVRADAEFARARAEYDVARAAWRARPGR